MKGMDNMNYKLTEEQQTVQAAVRKLAKEKVAPRAAEIDRTGEYPSDIFKIVSEQGLLAAGIPEEYGGTGADLLSQILAVEELAKVCGTSALIPAVQELGLMPILVGGNEEQKKKYLPPLASGEAISAFALTERDAGSDAGATKTKAEIQGNSYIINGEKCFITNGSIANTVTVFALTSPDVGLKGMSAFIVEADTPGFKVGRLEDKMGIRGAQVSELIFEDCKVPKENLLGKEGDGFKIAMKTLDKTRPIIGGQGLGLAQGAFDVALDYCKQRKQFGKPVYELQGIQFIFAELATQIESARQLLYKAASLIEEESKTEGRFPPEVSRYSAMSKMLATDVAMKVTTEAVQLMGGYGYMKDYPLERMMRDAKITQIYEGTNQVQKVVIARTL